MFFRCFSAGDVKEFLHFFRWRIFVCYVVMQQRSSHDTSRSGRCPVPWIWSEKTAHGRYLVSNEFQESYHHSNIFDKYDESREIIADICIYSLGQGI